MELLTRKQVALIAAAASALTSTMHAGIQAIFGLKYSSDGLVVGYVFGRVLGDIPLVIICFGVAYGFLKLSMIQADGASSYPPSK
ncbi:MAG: hypothetical protein ILNGONEN_01828 [Syntrophorhabdaceae bacterium]|nr:hypothetical protein [Syntrophorhabdaceae bacterium]